MTAVIQGCIVVVVVGGGGGGSVLFSCTVLSFVLLPRDKFLSSARPALEITSFSVFSVFHCLYNCLVLVYVCICAGFVTGRFQCIILLVVSFLSPRVPVYIHGLHGQCK